MRLVLCTLAAHACHQGLQPHVCEPKQLVEAVCARQEHATLHVPLGDADAAAMAPEGRASALTEVAWSPAGTPRALLTVTCGGRYSDSVLPFSRSRWF